MTTDPKNLIADSYEIDGITPEECRSVFLDWALSVPMDADHKSLITALIDKHGGDADHPMTLVLKEGLEKSTPSGKRRGGFRSRPRPNAE